MRITIRAGVSILLVLGFFALIVVYAIGVPFGALWLAYTVSSGNVLVLILVGVGIGVLVGGLVGSLTTVKAPPFVPHGVPLYRQDAPELWKEIDDVAARVGTRPPDQLWLTGDLGASVIERARLLGLLPGPRMLRIGWPAVLGMSRGQLRAVLAHEHGHFAHQHSRLQAVSHRTHLAIAGVVERFTRRRRDPLGWLFRGYAALFLLVQRAVSRQQELEADRIMGRVAGRTDAQAALRTLEVVDTLWQVYWWQYVHSGLHVGLAPSNIFGGFASLLDVRRDTVEVDFNTPMSRWDTHPTVADRLWALDSAPDTTDTTDGAGEPAAGLVPDVADRLEAVCFEFGQSRRLPWEDYGREAWLAELEPAVHATYRAIARVTGEPATLAALLTLCETEGSLWRLREAHLPSEGIAAVIDKAAYDAGAIRFEHRWEPTPRIVTANGEGFDLEHIVDDITSETIEGLRRARTALAELGIDLTKVHEGPTRVKARDAETIGAMAHVTLDDHIYYLFITDLGLLFVPCTDTSDNGKKKLLELAAERPAELAARPGAVWLPTEELAGAKIHRQVPIKATLRLHNGAVHEIAQKYTGYVHGKSHDTVLTALSLP